MRVLDPLLEKLNNYVDFLVYDPKDRKIRNMEEINRIDRIKEAELFFYSYFDIKMLVTRGFHDIGGIKNIKEFIEFTASYIDYEMPISIICEEAGLDPSAERAGIKLMLNNKEIRHFHAFSGYQYVYEHDIDKVKTFIPATNTQIVYILGKCKGLRFEDEMTKTEAGVLIGYLRNQKNKFMPGCFHYYLKES